VWNMPQVNAEGKVLGVIVPCPFCARNDMLFMQEINPVEPSPTTGEVAHAVYCLSCFARGPLGHTVDDAILRWQHWSDNI